MKKTNMVSAGAIRSVGFDDFSEYESKECTFPTQINFRYGQAIDNISVSYNEIHLEKHGSDGGSPADIAILPGEHIIKITGVIAHYWNNSFIFNLMFHTDQGRDIGIENQWDGITVQGFPFSIEFDEGYGLACLFGEVASPFDYSQPVPNCSFLSAIGAYQKPIEN